MHKRYPRAWKKKYQAKRAALVADRLLGKKKKHNINLWPKFSGSKMMISIQYGGNILINNPRTSFIISGIGGA
jgi:hypothetical protein